MTRVPTAVAHCACPRTAPLQSRNERRYRCAQRHRRGSAIADVRRGRLSEPFPFDQELLLDAAPMRPGKRMPILLVEPSGNAKIDLWCKSVPARIEISDMAIKIELGPLPEGLPEMLSVGQCTPERMQADQVARDASAGHRLAT